jgi:hypothetical protein
VDWTTNYVPLTNAYIRAHTPYKQARIIDGGMFSVPDRLYQGVLKSRRDGEDDLTTLSLKNANNDRDATGLAPKALKKGHEVLPAKDYGTNRRRDFREEQILLHKGGDIFRNDKRRMKAIKDKGLREKEKMKFAGFLQDDIWD